MVSVAVLAWVTDREAADGVRVKLPVDDTTVSAMVVDEVSEPDVPVTVTVEVPTVAAAVAVKVITLVVVVGLVL
jgi:hypothetical protein